MDDLGPGPMLESPVWYEPLLEPAWILPSERAGAQRICFAAVLDPAADAALSLGLPLYLAEAIRMTTDAVTSSFTRGFEAVSDGSMVAGGWVGLTRVEQGTAGITLGVRVIDQAGSPIAELERTGLDGPALGAVLSEFPRLLAQELRSSGVTGVWATSYVPPSPAHALGAVLGQHLCMSLRHASAHPNPDLPNDERLSRRSAAKGALIALGDLASRSGQLFPAMLLFGGVAATRAAKNDVFRDLRQTVAALTMRASNPTDPLNRMSVMLFRMFDEQGTADSREKAALASGDEVLRQWLMRVRALRWEH